MKLNLAKKIIKSHLVSGIMETGNEIGLKIDQTLTQDATGTMAYLQFEAMGVSKVKTELSVSYVDHNTLQSGFENADDHKFLQTIAAKYGLVFSPAVLCTSLRHRWPQCGRCSTPASNRFPFRKPCRCSR